MVNSSEKSFIFHSDMFGDANSNAQLQYLRDGVLMTEAEENKLHQVTSIRVILGN